MPEEFIMLACGFDDLKHAEQLIGLDLTNPKILSFLDNSFELIRKKAYDFAPIDKAGIAKEAASVASKVNSIPSLISILSTLKPGALESQLLPFCKDDRDPEKVIQKKLAPVTDIAVGYFISQLFGKLFPIKFKAQGSPKKKEFRFASNYKGWVIIRKANLEVAEKREVLACLVHTLESFERKFRQFHPNPAFFTRVDLLLAKYPQRKSFGKMLLALQEAQLEGLLSQSDPFLNKYALYKILCQLGYSPILSGQMLERIYPELKIPKPRGRMKKA
ncbi:MAG: hypothetical protein AABX01_02210 [Candidatus Micrarchaeota archaeon]